MKVLYGISVLLLMLTACGNKNNSSSETTDSDKTTENGSKDDSTTSGSGDSNSSSSGDDNSSSSEDSSTSGSEDSSSSGTGENGSSSSGDDSSNTGGESSGSTSGGGTTADTTEDDLITDAIITLSDNASTCNLSSASVLIEGNVITILKGREYTISGSLSDGQIIVNVGETENAILNLSGVNISCSTSSPICINSGNEVDISAKKGTNNYIIDNRSETTLEEDAAIYSLVDLDIKGKGYLSVEGNCLDGIHCKDDLTIKNLTLDVLAKDNAIKGNDSLTIESATIKAISTNGDALKTSNSDISSKGNQRGIITISSSNLKLYASCDGIDAAYDVIINDSLGTESNINIYTSTFSEYSEGVIESSESIMYLRFQNGSMRPGSSSFNYSNYTYSVLFTLDDGSTKWVEPTYKTTVQNGPSSYVYYSLDLPTNSTKFTVYAYSSSQTINSESDYTYKTDLQTINSNYDTFAITGASSTSLTGSFTNYQAQSSGGMGGGMTEGNSNKQSYSCKGIKADNCIYLYTANINIYSYDDAIHASSGVVLENSETSLGNVVIEGTNIYIETYDDGIHADNDLTITSGTIKINKCYEGLEGNIVNINGGNITVISDDDSVNAMTTLNIAGGTSYFYTSGDGLDSNGSINVTGGNTVVVGPYSGGNNCVDKDTSLNVTGGNLIAIASSSAMWEDLSSNVSGTRLYNTNCGSSSNIAVVDESGNVVVYVNLPKTSSIGFYAFGDYTSSNKVLINVTYTGDVDSNGVSYSGTATGTSVSATLKN